MYINTQRYLKASHYSSKFHQYFVDAQNYASTNLNFKLVIDIDTKSVSSNDSHTNEHADQLSLVSKQSEKSTKNNSFFNPLPMLRLDLEDEISQYSTLSTTL